MILKRRVIINRDDPEKMSEREAQKSQMNWQSPAAANQRSDNPVIQIDEDRIV